MNFPADPLSKPKVTVGSDPEMFALHKDTKIVVPAFIFLPDRNQKLGDSKETVPLYWDGFQAEWKYPKGFTCLEVLRCETRRMLQFFWKLAEKADAIPSLRNVVNVPLKMMENLPPQFVDLGCTPSLNAYGRDPLQVGNPRKLLTRWAGGHIHIGYREKIDYVETVKVMDALLGLWAVGAAQKFDDPERRKYYGLAGEFRNPTYGSYLSTVYYGLEYRTLSNFWLSHPVIQMAVFEIARQAWAVAQNEYLRGLLVADDMLVQTAINTCDVELAKKLLQVNKDLFIYALSGPYEDKDKPADVAEYIWSMQDGIHTVIDDPEDLLKNWRMFEGGFPYGNDPLRNSDARVSTIYGHMSGEVA
jgi:hypothetical protein